ncbi:hypothetical protein J6590_003034 [Homalodisca vitripennis]|nr:hypothetical protein J6590_003034 [Homalodisca vitripennis]
MNSWRGSSHDRSSVGTIAESQSICRSEQRPFSGDANHSAETGAPSPRHEDKAGTVRWTRRARSECSDKNEPQQSSCRGRNTCGGK